MTFEPLKEFISTIEAQQNHKRREQIINRLNKLGCDYTIQEYPFFSSNEKGHNIIVPLAKGEKRIIIGAHYDVAKGGGGANDNGSGVSVLLGYIQNCIKQEPKYTNGVTVIFFDHEETPESGAKYYVQNTNPENIKGMFNLDICGMGNTIIYDDKRKSDIPIVVAVKEAIQSHGYKSVLLPELPASDEQQFEATGIPNIQLSVIPSKDVSLVIKLVSAQKEVRDKISKGEITPREADDIIKNKLGGASLPKILKVMHTPEDLVIHLSEKTLSMMLNTLHRAVVIFDKKK